MLTEWPLSGLPGLLAQMWDWHLSVNVAKTAPKSSHLQDPSQSATVYSPPATRAPDLTHLGPPTFPLIPFSLSCRSLVSFSSKLFPASTAHRRCISHHTGGCHHHLLAPGPLTGPLPGFPVSVSILCGWLLTEWLSEQVKHPVCFPSVVEYCPRCPPFPPWPPWFGLWLPLSNHVSLPSALAILMSLFSSNTPSWSAIRDFAHSIPSARMLFPQNIT